MKINIEQEAITLVKNEKGQWQTATAFVTEKVAFQMRNLIRQLRKNYWGIFDSPIDPTTGRKKIWVPLTESLVESVVKNIDLDTKDITFRAKRPGVSGLVSLVRSVAKNELDYIGFGESLDELERMIAIDGTAVWKTLEYYDETRKKVCVKIVPVDLLNFYIDPTAHSIQETDSVIERAILTIDEIKDMDGWINTDVDGVTNLDRGDGEVGYGHQQSTSVKAREVFERWGKMSKFLITGKESDRKEIIEGRIVVSSAGSDWVVHLIEKTSKPKPYEEAWYTRVPGRWYGKGVAEKVMMLQLWINTIVNIRINRSYVTQLGIFKIRQGSGITPQSISRLAANGAITVQTMQDIEQIAMQDASPASYRDEDNSMSWARQVTGAFEAVTGETMPASTTATIGAIQNRNATSQFSLIKEGIGMFLQRWMKNHAMPIMLSSLKRKDVVRYYPDRLQDYDQQIISQEMYEQIEKIDKEGGFIDPIQAQTEMQRAMQKLQSGGEERFIEVDDVPNIMDYDVAVQITNEDYDTGVMVQNLITALQAAPEYKQPILEEIFDKMGIGPFKAPPQIPQMTPPTGAGQQDPTEVTAQANTGEAFGKAQALINM